MVTEPEPELEMLEASTFMLAPVKNEAPLHTRMAQAFLQILETARENYRRKKRTARRIVKILPLPEISDEEARSFSTRAPVVRRKDQVELM